MAKFEIHPTTLELFGLLSNIDPRLPIEKEGNGIVIKNSNDKGTIAYELVLTNQEADGDEEAITFIDFETNDEKVSFTDFKKFMNLRKALTNPTIEITEDSSLLTMTEGRSSIEFNLGDTHIISRMFDDIPSGDDGYLIKYEPAISKDINKKCIAIGADRVTLSINGDDVTLKLWSGDHHNAWSETMEGVVESFGSPTYSDFTINNTIFTMIPYLGEDVSMAIQIEEEKGILIFVLKTDFMQLKVFTPLLAE